MKKVRYFLLMALVGIMLVSCTDYPTVPGPPPNYDYSFRRFKFEAVIPTDDSMPVNYVALEKDEMRSHYSLFCKDASCNLTPAVMLEMNHNESGDPERLEIEGNLWITLDRDNFLYGTYLGSGVRIDSHYLCEFSCDLITVTGKGMFNTEETILNLCIKGISEQGNPETVAYKVVIDGYLRNPKAIN